MYECIHFPVSSRLTLESSEYWHPEQCFFQTCHSNLVTLKHDFVVITSLQVTNNGFIPPENNKDEDNTVTVSLHWLANDYGYKPYTDSWTATKYYQFYVVQVCHKIDLRLYKNTIFAD